VPRIQQAFITMLNIALTQPYAKLDETLQNDEQFHIGLSKLLDSKSIVLRQSCLELLTALQDESHLAGRGDRVRLLQKHR